MKRLVLEISVLLIFASITYYLWMVYKAIEWQGVYPGVRVAGFELAGFSREQINVLIKLLKMRIADRRVFLYSDSRVVSFKVSDFLLEFMPEEDPLSEGRQGGFKARIKGAFSYFWKGKEKDISVLVSLDLEKIEEAAKKVVEFFNVRAIPAVVYRRGSNRFVSRELNGLETDLYSVSLALKEVLKSCILKGECTRKVDSKVVVPHPTRSEILDNYGVKYMVASYETPVNSFIESNRVQNLKVAVDKIDGLMLFPFDEFSFNRVVGPRTLEAGFKEGKSIIGGKLVKSVGGGVCQVATTVYDAAFLADMDITERWNHSIFFPSIAKYSKPGFDAAVVYGYKDLKFRNNKPYTVAILTDLNVKRLRVEFWAEKLLPYSVTEEVEIKAVLNPRVKYVVDELLAANATPEVVDEGVKGYIARTFRIKIKDGRVLQKEEMGLSRYRVVDRVVKVPPGYAKNKTKNKIR